MLWKSKVQLLIVSFMLLVISLLVKMPVSHGLRLFTIPPAVSISGISGSIIQGHLDAVKVNGLTLQNINYSMKAQCLVNLKVCYQISSDDFALKVNLQFNPLSQVLSITDTQFQIHSASLEALPQLLVKPKGEFSVKINTIDISDQVITALDSTLLWENAGIDGENQIVGDYIGHAVLKDKSIIVNFDDKNSLLTLDGQLAVNNEGQYQINMRFKSDPELKQSYKSALGLFTKRNGVDNFSISRAGILQTTTATLLGKYLPK